MVKLADVEDILHQMEATSPQAALLVDLLRKRYRRGRPQIQERHYRQLMLWWKSFQRWQGDIPLATAWAKFQHQHGDQIAKLLGIKRGRYFRGTRGQNPNSFLNAVARGADEHDRIRQHRPSNWQILQLSLWRSSLITDPDMAEYLRAAQHYRLFGTGPIKPLIDL